MAPQMTNRCPLIQVFDMLESGASKSVRHWDVKLPA
jgi:hypothetical protein